MSVTTVGLSGSEGTAVTAPAGTNTKGSWATISSSTPHDAGRLIVCLMDPSRTGSGNDDFLVDIAKGGVGSEVIILANLVVSSCQVQGGHARYDFPYDLPAGTRLSARVQSTRTAFHLHVAIVLISGTTVTRTITTYGADTTDSGGTNIDPGTTINTKGAWVQMTASSVATEAIVLGYGNAAATLGLGSIRANPRDYFVDIGTGLAGAEVVVIANLNLHNDTTGLLVPYMSPILPFEVPAGTRIVARAQMNGANPTAADRQLDLVLYAVSAGHSTAYPPGDFDQFSDCASVVVPPVVSPTPTRTNNGLVFDFVRAQSSGEAVWVSRVSQFADFATHAYVDGVRETLYVRNNAPGVYRLHVTGTGTLDSYITLPWTTQGSKAQKFQGLTIPYTASAPVDVYVRYASNPGQFESATFALVQTLPAHPTIGEPARILVGSTSRWFQLRFRSSAYGFEVATPIDTYSYETQRVP